MTQSFLSTPDSLPKPSERFARGIVVASTRLSEVTGLVLLVGDEQMYPYTVASIIQHDEDRFGWVVKDVDQHYEIEAAVGAYAARKAAGEHR